MFGFLRQDLRFALRSLRKRPVFVLIPVASLAIGIGANTAIFSVVNHFLLKVPAGIPNAARMVEVGRGVDGDGFDTFSYPDFLDLRAQAQPLEQLAAYEFQMLTLSQGEAGDRVFGMLVSANYFDVLGVRAAVGRTFLAEEDEGPNEHPVAVLSHEYWASRLGSDPSAVGSTVLVSRQPYTVVGVLPEAFHSHMALARPAVYVPIMQHPALNEGQDFFSQRNSSWLMVLALLRPGAEVDEADAAVSTIFQRLAEEYPETNSRRTAAVRPFGSLPVMARGPVALFFGILMGLVGLLLLITCANVAGMFLAKASARRREIAIRISVGSGRGHLLRHLLTESLLVFLLGGLGGGLLAVWALDLLSGFQVPAPFPVDLSVSPDARVLLFGLAVTLVTGLIFGLLPARQALELDLVSTLKGEGSRPRSSEGRLRRVFVTSQVGASLVLLVVAGLLLQALRRAGEIEQGFKADGVYLTLLDLSTEGFDSTQGAVFQDQMLTRFSNLPWVESAALSIDLPLDLSSHGTGVLPDGWEPSPDRPYLGVDFNFVSPAYFETLSIPVLEGRPFRESDRAGAEPVAIVSRTFGREVWPGESALGRRILWGASGDTYLTIVGVVADTHNQLLTDEAKPFVYRPLAQSYRSGVSLLVRTDLIDPPIVVREVHEGLRSLEPNLSLSPVIGLAGYTSVGLLPQRMAGLVSASLGALALLLSGMGVYGVMAYMVSRSTREIGVRIALGAEPGSVLRTVLVRAFRLALPGLVAGAFLAAGAGFLLRSMLLGVSPADPLTLVGVSLALGLMVLIGTLLPARRAASVDPAVALRRD